MNLTQYNKILFVNHHSSEHVLVIFPQEIYFLSLLVANCALFLAFHVDVRDGEFTFSGSN